MAPLNNLLHSFDLSQYLESLTLKEREDLTHPHPEIARRDENEELKSPGPWAAVSPSPSTTTSLPTPLRVQLQARNNPTGALPTGNGQPTHGGAIDPNEVNMVAVQSAFAVIGCAMVVGIIWFFFWAKNGGFQWRRGDWDDYKSTVLRRKGPNGTTLSNATKSTRLGGGSVVGQGFSDRDTNSYMDDTSTIYTGTMTELSSSTAPIIKEKQGQYTGDKRDRKKKSRRKEDNAKERKQREMKEAAFEGAHDDDVRAYMAEKPARVGGINAHSDTLHYGTDYTDTEPSVHSSAPRQSARHQPSAAAAPPPPTVPQHHKQPSSSRGAAKPSKRDFSYTIGGHQEQKHFSIAPSQRSASPPPLRVPARSIQQENTQAYFHPIPGLSGAAQAGRQQQNGFRRGAGTDLDD
ncbi:hypothetical protein LTR05_008215 [Lithohypha guttulata]|uniref:Uncharacterized protein n=1 Tax=Lithohypha guttulata TaxID=1690604 RepID=A0AAN7STA1_9EURO|nr:hypothetical protein LTR05_008215 [Lithohypha guttulata]